MAVRQFPGVEFNNTCVVCHAPDHPTRPTAGAGASTAPPGDFEREPPPAPGSSEGEMSLLAKGNCYRLGSELYLVLPVLCSDGHDGEVLAKAPANTPPGAAPAARSSAISHDGPATVPRQRAPRLLR